MVFWKEIHALFHFWWLSGYSNPSALCGQTWSLDKPHLKPCGFSWAPPFISKILEFFLIFESKASIKLTVQYKCLFWIYWFQIASYLHLFASIWANKNPHEFSIIFCQATSDKSIIITCDDHNHVWYFPLFFASHILISHSFQLNFFTRD